MGKVKGEKKSHRGLADELLDPIGTEAKKSVRSKLSDKEQHEVDSGFVGEKLSSKILQQARAQQDELEDEFNIGSSKKSSKEQKSKYLGTDGAENNQLSDDEDEGEGDFHEEQFYEEIAIDKNDEKILEHFMSKEPCERRTLADIIMEKITQKKTEIQSQMSDSGPEVAVLDEKVVSVYNCLGEILSKYRAGKLPKAFKVIPALTNWEEILHCTNPDTWTAAAMYQATRLFASNLNAKMAQRFFNLVLYPRVRDDIAEYKRLNYHLYMALKKALFKPAAFFKGILLPLCESKTCSLREAVIIGSVLSKTSIPVLHSAAVMLKIAEMEYGGANSIFLRILLDKKYALPFRVIDSLVYHFVNFQNDTRELPVLWHQALLVFVQRYKEDIASEQKEALLELCKKHHHYEITREVRRELMHSKSRDEEIPSEAANMPMIFDD